MTRDEAVQELLDEGLRPTEAGEDGWAWFYYDDDGERQAVWVTDEPLPADAISWD